MTPSPSLAPSSSPGETGALGVWGSVSALLIAFGVDPSKSLAVSGAAAAFTPYIVKWWLHRKGK